MKRRLVITATEPVTLRTFVAPQLGVLSASGWDIHLVAGPGDWGHLASDVSLQTHQIEMTRSVAPFRDLQAEVRWVRLLRQIQPEIIVGSTPKAAMLSMVAARLVQVPVRVYLHRGARWESTTGATRSILGAADRLTMLSATDVLAVSNSLADLLTSEGLTRRRPKVLGKGGSKGVNLQRFRPTEDGLDTARAPTIGYLGRLNRDKGIDTVLRVFDDLKTLHPNVRLLVGGELDSENAVPGEIVERLRGTPDIEWRGRVDSAHFLPELDVLVFPSLREGLPNAVIEAAACGVPTAAWDVTGVRDAVLHGVTGELVPLGAIPDLVQATSSLLAAPRARHRQACRAWAEQFDQQRLARLFDEYLLALTTQPNGGS